MHTGSIGSRWLSAAAFYEERDHRTQLEVRDLHSYVYTPVEIIVDPEVAHDLTIQRIALLTTNLTARWARNVTVLVPDVALAGPLQIHGDTHLQPRLAREMSEADPFGVWQFKEKSNSDQSALRLHIGSDSVRPLIPSDYVVDASGWSALGRRGMPSTRRRRSAATAPAAALAAAIGAADLFKRAVGHAPEAWLGSVNWCTWSHALTSEWPEGDVSCDIPAVADLGNLLLAGAGAIGSALLYILSLMPARGRMTVLDRDSVEPSNLNRSPLFTAKHAVAAMKKTEVARQCLGAIGVDVETVEGPWRAHGDRLSREPFDAWVSLTNEDGAWAEVPFQLPPIVLHGTTTSGWGANLGRHIPRTEDCTACRLPRPTVAFRGPCAEGDVCAQTPAAQPVRASLPFLSTAAAALVASELLKLNCPGVEALPNAVSADFRSGLPAVIALSLSAKSTCRGCQMASLSLWGSRGGRSRYARLSSIANYK